MHFKQSLMLIGIIVSVAVISIPVGMVIAEEKLIPEWFKTSLKYYVNGETSDTDLITSLEFLAKEGIIKIGQKQYDPFSLEKFPETGGFNPEWLKDNREKILKNCQESSKMGFENKYCKYIQ